MQLSSVALRVPESANVIVGQAHFIKTAEDLGEIAAGAAPGARFGLAFNEASGPCLIRVEGNDEELRAAAVANAQAIGAGHVFVLLVRGVYPVHLLDRVKACLEVCTVFCATANAVEVLVVESAGGGRGVVGVIDGEPPRGVESRDDAQARRRLLRELGYKL
ncbi:MAG TPA: adenosine-specific kinase [Ideonella sp.]|nr:adenosine-specific kinase [Ideonella sp.]